MTDTPTDTSTEGPMEDRILVEVTVPAPADVVWRALRDKDQILNWFGWDADSLPAEVDFIFFDHAAADDEKRILSFPGMPDRYEVEARGDHSVVRVVRSAPATGEDWQAVFEDMTEGWIAFTQQLAFALAWHVSEARRTLFLSGAPKTSGALNGAAALGMDDLPAQGEPWSGTAGPDALSGEVWHLGRHQAGVATDGYGGGLLVVTGRQPDSKAPDGASSVTLTTYGLSDADFAALETRWRGWWDERFQPRPESQQTCE